MALSAGDTTSHTAIMIANDESESGKQPGYLYCKVILARDKYRLHKLPDKGCPVPSYGTNGVGWDPVDLQERLRKGCDLLVH
jgi:hypothetical protein